jgi:hypothetical protein
MGDMEDGGRLRRGCGTDGVGPSGGMGSGQVFMSATHFPANNGILLEQIVFFRFQPYKPGDALG